MGRVQSSPDAYFFRFIDLQEIFQAGSRKRCLSEEIARWFVVIYGIIALQANDSMAARGI